MHAPVTVEMAEELLEWEKLSLRRDSTLHSAPHGRLKVSGTSPSAYVVKDFGRPAYGHVLGAPANAGSLVRIDSREAERLPGVLLVMNQRNLPGQGLMDARHGARPIALVVAESIEQARFAAQRIRVSCPDQDAQRPALSTPTTSDRGPETALVQWQGDKVRVHCATPWRDSDHARLAATLQLPEENVHIVSRGDRALTGNMATRRSICDDVIFAALASRKLKRPVRVALSEQA